MASSLTGWPIRRLCGPGIDVIAILLCNSKQNGMRRWANTQSVILNKSTIAEETRQTQGLRLMRRETGGAITVPTSVMSAPVGRNRPIHAEEAHRATREEHARPPAKQRLAAAGDLAANRVIRRRAAGHLRVLQEPRRALTPSAAWSSQRRRVSPTPCRPYPAVS